MEGIDHVLNRTMESINASINLEISEKAQLLQRLRRISTLCREKCRETEVWRDMYFNERNDREALENSHQISDNAWADARNFANIQLDELRNRLAIKIEKSKLLENRNKHLERVLCEMNPLSYRFRIN